MAKRFIATQIWDEDWFLNIPTDYKLFWYYLLSNCDHAGIFKVNLRSFCLLNGVNINSKDALSFFNNGKERIRELSESTWFIEDFFVFQYGSSFNTKNRVHESISTVYKKYNIPLTSIRGLIDPIHGVKDKDKDKDKDIVKVNKSTKKPKDPNKPIFDLNFLDLEMDNMKIYPDQYEKLTKQYGQVITDKAIKYLSDWKIEKGKESKSDYLTIKRWVIDAVKKQVGENQTTSTLKIDNSIFDKYK